MTTAPQRTRRYRAVEPIDNDVKTLIHAAKKLEPVQAQRLILDFVNQRIDDELEALAKWLSGEWDPNVDTDHVKALIAAGQPRRGLNAIVAQMRRETVEEVRRHKRADADGFVELAEDC